jgi:dihydrofolate reductase
MTAGSGPWVIAGMTMSLDGFVEDARGSVALLYPDLAALRGTLYMDDLIAETGAVLMGRRAFEMSPDPDWYVGNYEFQVPIFVLTHHPPATPPKHDEHLTFTFVDDSLESAVDQARTAAGGKAVTVVGGISTIRQLLRARLVDELRLDLMPVLLGAGRRLFDEIEADGPGLEKIAAVEAGQRTSLRFRVTR